MQDMQRGLYCSGSIGPPVCHNECKGTHRATHSHSRVTLSAIVQPNTKSETPEDGNQKKATYAGHAVARHTTFRIVLLQTNPNTAEDRRDLPRKLLVRGVTASEGLFSYWCLRSSG